MSPLIRSIPEPLAANRLGQNPLLTGLVLGQPQFRTYPSRRIFRRIITPAMTFKWMKFTGNERLKEYSAERGLRAEIGRIGLSGTYDSATLKRYTLGAEADVLELQDALPELQYQARLSAIARDAVTGVIERVARDMLTTTTNYPSTHRLAIAGGSEWDSGSGDSKSDIQTVATAIMADAAIPMANLSVYLGPTAAEAALNDNTFLSTRVYTDNSAPDLSALQKYWGVKEVWTGSPMEVVDGSTTPTLMYGDVAILYFDGPTADMDTTYGEYLFGATFGLNRGVALNPWYEEERTTWVFPYEDIVLHKITNNTIAGIITNCAA